MCFTASVVQIGCNHVCKLRKSQSHSLASARALGAPNNGRKCRQIALLQCRLASSHHANECPPDSESLNPDAAVSEPTAAPDDEGEGEGEDRAECCPADVDNEWLALHAGSASIIVLATCFRIAYWPHKHE